MSAMPSATPARPADPAIMAWSIKMTLSASVRAIHAGRQAARAERQSRLTGDAASDQAVHDTYVEATRLLDEADQTLTVVMTTWSRKVSDALHQHDMADIHDAAVRTAAQGAITESARCFWGLE